MLMDKNGRNGWKEKSKGKRVRFLSKVDTKKSAIILTKSFFHRQKACQDDKMPKFKMKDYLQIYEL